jgi:hypothetical protein
MSHFSVFFLPARFWILDVLVKQMLAASEKFHFIFSHELHDRIQIKM